MADKRINALATTASSTASDDFIAVDGTTNGTRKLNAFSPTFGGNVVVTGTLTSQSTLSTSAGLSCQNADITGGYITLRGYGDQNGGLIFLGQSSNNNYILSNASTIATVIANTGITDVVAAGLRVKATTASTTTSSGALVVGNGTSGGLGVGGSINAGGNVTISGSNGYAVIGGRQWSFRANSSGGSPASGCVIRDDSAAADRLTIDINGNTSVLSTTASTSTSSGALVVSGGVGVAGAVFTGGYVHPGGDSTFYIRGTGSNNGLIRGNVTSVDVDASFSVRNGDGSSTYLSVASTGLIAAIPATAPSLTVNGTMTFERTSNTSLKISVRGTDGTTRSVSLTLA